MHEGITLIIAVYTGTTEGEREKRALGCSPVWLPVTVKCFSLWKERSHLSEQVFRFKQLPVWKCVRHPTDPPPFSLFVRYLANKKNNFVFAVTGSAVWEDGGEGGQRSALQPVHGGELGVPECPSLLHEADQRDFPQWGHESHVSPINTSQIYRLGSIEGKYVWS